MKDELAIRLLARIMNWEVPDVSIENPSLQALAMYKYDDYDQFSPGMKFIESLALWLKQFKTDEEKKIAYRFVKEKLIFISNREMEHLVEISFPDVIRPFLMNKVAKNRSIPDWKIHKIVEDKDFKLLLRQSLFLGLSDGAHTDIFRRSNLIISNEQIFRAHEITKNRSSEMLTNLKSDLTTILGNEPDLDQIRFRVVFLLDDFSASGISYIREESGETSLKGKIANFHNSIVEKDNPMLDLVDTSNLHACLVLYVATQYARNYLGKKGKELFGNIPFDVMVIHSLNDSVKLDDKKDREFIELFKKYNDDSIVNRHYKRGRIGKPYLGFDEGALPLILSHNTPNNSIPLLWLEDDPRKRKYRGLFPRISRHQ